MPVTVRPATPESTTSLFWKAIVAVEKLLLVRVTLKLELLTGKPAVKLPTRPFEAQSAATVGCAAEVNGCQAEPSK